MQMTELLSISFHSVEFYVILFTVAALAAGLIARPGDKGEAQTTFTTGVLGRAVDLTPRLEVRCLDNGDVELRRFGLTGLTENSTVALAITRIGFNLTVEERITPGDGSGEPVECATFVIKGLAAERYHLKYNSDAYSTFLATTFPNRPGINFSREFRG